jgi:hypothetical protein
VASDWTGLDHVGALAEPASSGRASAIVVVRFFGRNLAKRLCEDDSFAAFRCSLTTGLVELTTPAPLAFEGGGVCARWYSKTVLKVSCRLNLKEAAETESLSEPLSEALASAPSRGVPVGE